MNKLITSTYYFKVMLLSLFYLITQNAVAKNTIEYENINEIKSIGSSLLIYEDESNALGIEEVLSKKFISTKNQVPNLGISESTFWIKFSIKNLTNQPQLMLNLALPTLDNLIFYYPNSNTNNYTSINAGEQLPFYDRKYKDPDYLFDLYIQKEKTETYYLKISSKEAIQLPISVGSKSVILNQVKKKDILSGSYFGLMMVMILYNLFIYFSVKDKSYVYYVVYIILILLTQTSLQGYPFQYLWPNHPKVAQNSLFIFPSLVGIASMVFMNVFLKVKFYYKTLFNLSFLLSIPYIVSIFFALFQSYKISFIIMEVNAMIVSIYMLITTIKIVKRGYQPAKYFLVAWVIFLSGVIIYILKDFEVLPFNNFTRYTMQIGSAIETILLSFALAARINIYKKEKEESQQKTVEVLKENEKIIRDQNIVLEQKVEERTTELNLTLSDLKEAQSQLVDAEKMSSLGQLTAGIAHEINNPINFVSSNIAPLRQDIEDVNAIIEKCEELKNVDNIEEKLKEIDALKKELDFGYLKTELSTIIDGIEDGAKRTTEIVSGLRNFSRLDEGELKKADINEGLASTLVLIKNKLNGIKVSKSFGDIPPIECNPGKINQLAMNLIDNAIYAIKERGIENGLIDLITESNNKTILLTIKDNGVGIANDIKNKLFDPFFTTKDVGEGTGLGLSIVRNIIENHNGKITVNSEVNVGTEMIVEIPIKRETDGEN